MVICRVCTIYVCPSVIDVISQPIWDLKHISVSSAAILPVVDYKNKFSVLLYSSTVLVVLLENSHCPLLIILLSLADLSSQLLVLVGAGMVS
jgi:hypothetical protein